MQRRGALLPPNAVSAKKRRASSKFDSEKVGQIPAQKEAHKVTQKAQQLAKRCEEGLIAFSNPHVLLAKKRRPLTKCVNDTMLTGSTRWCAACRRRFREQRAAASVHDVMAPCSALAHRLHKDVRLSGFWCELAT